MIDPRSGSAKHSNEEHFFDAVSPRRRCSIVLIVVLCSFLTFIAFIPLSTIVQIGADEGFELAKATLCLKGHHLYTEVWNDQPPLHTFLITQVLKHISHSILGPRLLTVGFSLLLLSALFGITLRCNGLLVAGICTALVMASPGFLELGSSCMLEIPALALTTFALLILISSVKASADPITQTPVGIFHSPSKKWILDSLAGVVFGLGLQMKLVPIIYLALVPLILWSGSFVKHRTLKQLFVRLSVFGASLAVSFAGVDLLIEHGGYLMNFGQSWASHFAPAKSGEYGAASQHPFQWDILLKNWDVTAPALIGLAVILMGRRNSFVTMLPSAWMALTFLVFALHRPWWPYYYLHTAIPMCWFAGIGAAFLIERIKSRPKGVTAIGVIIFGLGAISWASARLYLQVANLRHSPQTYASPVIDQMKRFQPVADWLYADKLIYSFHCQIPMVPSLAVVPIKRMWSGEMNNQRLTRELESYKPGLIALLNDGRDVPFKDLLDRDYQLVYMDVENRLYALKAIVRKAKPADL